MHRCKHCLHKQLESTQAMTWGNAPFSSIFYYCQRFYQVAIERNKILRYENLDKFITVNRYVLVSGRISNKFQYFERTNLVFNL